MNNFKKLILLLIIALIILSLFIFYSNTFQSFLGKSFSKYLSNKYSLPIIIDKIQINFFPPHLLIKNIYSPHKNFSVQLKEVYIEFSYKIYFGKWQEFQKIKIQEPEIHLSKQKIKFISSPTASIIFPPITIKNLEISNASINIKDKHIPFSLDILNLNISLSHIRGKKHRVYLNSSAIKGVIKNIKLPIFQAVSDFEIDDERISFHKFSLFNKENKIGASGTIIYQPQLYFTFQENSYINIPSIIRYYYPSIKNGTIKTSSIILFKKKKLTSKTRYTIDNLRYSNLKIDAIQGKLLFEPQKLEIIDSFCKYKQELINFNASFFYAFPIEDSNKSSLAAKLEANSSKKDIKVRLQANLKDNHLIFTEALFNFPGIQIKQHYTNFILENQNLDKIKINAAESVNITNYNLLIKFLKSSLGLDHNKYLSYLAKIQELKGSLNINYKGTLLKIQQANLASNLFIKIRGLPSFLLSAITNFSEKKGLIKKLEITSELGSILSKGEIKLGEPYWKEPQYINLSGEANKINLSELKEIYPLFQDISGNLNLNFNFRGNTKKYILTSLISSKEFKLNKEKLDDLSALFELKPKKLIIKELNISKEKSRINISGTYEINSSEFNANFSSNGNLKDIDTIKSLLSSLFKNAVKENLCLTEKEINGQFQINGNIYGSLKSINGNSTILLNNLKICEIQLDNIHIQALFNNSIAKIIANANSEEFLIEGEILLKPPYKTKLMAKIFDSHFFSIPQRILFPNTNADILFKGVITLEGYLLNPSSYSIHAEIANSELNYNNYLIKSINPYVIDYNKEKIVLHNLKIESDNSFVNLEGEIYLAAARKSSLSISGVINHKLLGVFLKDINISGRSSFNLNITQLTENPEIEGIISSEFSSIEAAKVKLKLNHINSQIIFKKDTINISITGAVGKKSFSIYGDLNTSNIIKFIYGNSKILPANINIDVPYLSLNDFYNMPEKTNAVISGKAKVKKISYLINLIEGEANIEKFSFTAQDYSIQNTDIINIQIYKGEAKLLKSIFEGEGSNFEIEGNLNLAKEEIDYINLRGKISIPLFATFIKGLTADGNLQFNTNIRGKFTNPLIQGNALLNLSSIELKEYSIYGSDIILQLSFNKDAANITKLMGELNGGEIKGEGSIFFKNLLSPELSVKLLLKEGNIFYPEGLTALANANLKITGFYPNLLMKGNVDILEAVFKKDIYPEQEALANYFSKQMIVEEISPIAKKINLDIFVSLPENFNFSNNLANVNATGDLRLMGSLSNPLIYGSLKIGEGGTVKYAQKEFLFLRGDINFTGKYYWKPSIDVSLQRKEKVNAVNYDINIEIKGDPDNLKINLWSQPPLPEKDIIKMLAGQSPSQLANNLFTVFSGKYSGYAAAKLEKIFHLQEFKIEPLLVSNEANPSARLTFGKSITPQFFLTYSLSLSNSSDQTWIADYSLFKNFTIRALRRDDGSYNSAIRQFWQFGYQPFKETIQPSPARKIRNIIIDGNTIFPKSQLKNLIKIKRNELYNFIKINEAIDNIKKFYQSNKYLTPKVKIDKIAISENLIDINFLIQPGKKFIITINEKEPSKKFKEEIYKLFRQSLPLNFILKEAEKFILYSYFKENYYEAKLKWNIKEDNSINFLDFIVEKGIKYHHLNLSFRGNNVISGKKLSKLLAINKKILFSELFYNFEKYKNIILLEYSRLGYYKVIINAPQFIFDKINKIASIEIEIKECPQAIIKEVSINRNKEQIMKLLGIKIGEVFFIENLQKGIEKTVDYYKQMGYSGTEVDYEYKFDPFMNTYITLFIKEGETETIDKIIISGNASTSPKLIKKHLLFKEGDKVNLEKFSLSQNNLYKLGIFKKVRIYSKRESKNELNTYIEVEELPRYTILYGVRYDNERKLEVEGEFVRQNLFHYAHSSSLRFLWNNNQKDFRIGYGIPFFIKRDWRLDNFIFWRREYFSCSGTEFLCYPFYTQIAGISIQHSFALNKNLTFQYSYNFKKIHTWPEQEGQGFDFQINVARLIANLYGDYRDDKLNPSHGYFYSIETELSPKKLGSDLNFIKIFGQFFYYYPIRNKIILANGVRIGLANAFGAILFYDERFFAGGGNSVRGYKLNSLGPINPFTNLPNGGEGLFILNEELRFPIRGIIGGVLFYDAGNIYKEWQDFNPFDVRQSIGLGLRADTKFGLLRFDLGFKIKKKPEEKPYELFFSIGQAF